MLDRGWRKESHQRGAGQNQTGGRVIGEALNQSDTTKIRNTAIEVVTNQDKLCQERYASDKDMVRLKTQIAVHWWLHGISVGALLALAWAAVKGVFIP